MQAVNVSRLQACLCVITIVPLVRIKIIIKSLSSFRGCIGPIAVDKTFFIYL